jgi:hypothetical protein
MDFGKEKLRELFATVGEQLHDHSILGEIEVHGSAAMMTIFDWIKTARDFDYNVRNTQHHEIVRHIVAKAATDLSISLPRIDQSVIRHRIGRTDSDTMDMGSFPTRSAFGLKVYVATPQRQFVTWLRTYASGDDVNFEEMVLLGVEIGVTSPEDAQEYTKLYVGEPNFLKDAEQRVKDLCSAINERRKRAYDAC